MLDELTTLLAAARSLPWRRDTFSMSKEGAGSKGTAKTVWTSSAYDPQGKADFALVAWLVEHAHMLLDALQPPKWQPIETAPTDGSLLILLVDYSGEDADNALSDEILSSTVGSNNFDNDGEYKWNFAGWCWSNDYFTEGHGVPTHWMPMPVGRF